MNIFSQSQSVLQGYGIFKSNSTTVSFLEKKEVRKVIMKAYWNIDDCSYTQQSWKQIFLNMIVCLALNISFSRNYNPLIIKQINQSCFKQLKQLSLIQNQITNIQAISYLNCPRLNKLYLSYNYINKINALWKWDIKNVFKLSLYPNLLTQIQSLNKISTQPNHYLQNIYIKKDMQFPGKKAIDCLILQDLSKLARIVHKIVYKIQIKVSYKIRQPRIYAMLKRKFVNAIIDDN